VAWIRYGSFCDSGCALAAQGVWNPLQAADWQLTNPVQEQCRRLALAASTNVAWSRPSRFETLVMSAFCYSYFQPYSWLTLRVAKQIID
jgi:hypothetical protein